VGEVGEGTDDSAEGIDEEELALGTFRHVIIRYARAVYRNAALARGAPVFGINTQN
jgi:hypothetical protein